MRRLCSTLILLSLTACGDYHTWAERSKNQGCDTSGLTKSSVVQVDCERW